MYKATPDTVAVVAAMIHWIAASAKASPRRSKKSLTAALR
jgi:hypothetical protein